MITISGVGWIAKNNFGSLVKRIRCSYHDVENLYLQLLEDKILKWPVKNFERFDATAKTACCSVALALNDAELSYSLEQKQNIGIFGTSSEGCTQSNAAYFFDYVDNGKKLARGNLFIYTLPTSALAEISINFGFNGPLMYLLFDEHNLEQLLDLAKAPILRKESEKMVIVYGNEGDTISFILENLDQSKKNLTCKI